MSTTALRLVPAEALMSHTAQSCSRNTWEWARRVGGTLITVQLPPVRPEEYWICGTRWVWEVSPESCAVLGLGHFPRRYVCEHQVELD